MRIIFIALLALMLLNITFAACPTASRDIYLAAVTGETSGGLFQLHVEVKPGNGSIYTRISPFTGISTQQSEEDAVKYAFASSGIDRRQCDVFFSMEGDFGSNTVDGPSAGAAMALATRAALLNKSIRRDMVVTGTINPDGTIGDVGGLLEKSLAAYGNGASYILVPSMEVPDAFILSLETGNGTFQAIEVANFSEAERMATSAPSDEFHYNFTPKNKPLPTLPQITYDAELGRFSLLAGRVVDDLRKQAEGLDGQKGMPDSLQGYFSSEIAKYEKLVALGYPFSAANSAFLLSIDVQYIRLGGGSLDLDNVFMQTAQCADGLSPPAKTRENFHWAVGSDLRRIWAQEKLNETMESRIGNHDEGYSLLRDLLYSQSWCGISSDLAAQANDIGGEPVNESLLSSLADRKLSEAEALYNETDSPDYDALWHLDNGYAAQEQGDYGAAIYEATYASTMQKIADSAPPKNLSLALKNLTSGSRDSLWGKIYYGQGKYLAAVAQDDASTAQSAYSILTYSANLDKVSSEMDDALAAGGQYEPAKKGGIAGTLVSAAILAYIALLVCLIVYRLARMQKGRKDG